MKKLLLILLMAVYVVPVHARVRAGFLYMWLSGKTSNSGNPKDFLNNISRSGFGMSINVDKEIFKHYHIGGGMNVANGSIKKESVENDLLAVYPGDYFNSANSYGSNAWEVIQFGITLSRTFQTGYVDIEPIVLIGIGHIWTNASFTIDRKKINDNYSEEIIISKKEGDMVFYPSFGVIASKHFYKRLSFNLGIMCNIGNASYTILENKKDFLEYSYPTSEHTFTKSLNAFQAIAGVQLTFPTRNIKIENQTGKH